MYILKMENMKDQAIKTKRTTVKQSTSDMDDNNLKVTGSNIAALHISVQLISVTDVSSRHVHQLK